MRALLIHVGADQTNQMTVGVNAPVFDDGTFEFIPILESTDDNMYFLRKEGRTIVVQNGEEREDELQTLETRTYCTIDARNRGFGKSLSEYLPEKYASAVVHFDPDFEGCTYGDYDGTPQSKGRQIAQLVEGNYIFFVASLAPYVKEAYNGRSKGLILNYQKGKMAKYVIGYFEVQASYFATKTPNDDPPLELYDPTNTQDPVNDRIDKTTMKRIWNNAHTKRNVDYYSIVVGNVSHSALLTHAIKLTENGSPFEPTDVGREVFGNVCYPRGIKWVEDASRIDILLNYCYSCK